MKPGPILSLDPRDYDLSVDPAEFAELVSGELAGLDPEDTIHADTTSALTALAATPVDQILGDDLSGAAAELDYQSGLPGPEDLDQAQRDAGDADQQIIDAYTDIPGEAWEADPLPFTGPPGGTTGVPTTPPEEPTQQVPPGVAPPGVTEWPPQPWVGLSNLSHPNTPFVVNDRWQIDVQGNAGAEVSMSGSQDDNAFGPTVLGTTNDRGHFILQGRMTGREVGHWSEDWFVSGNGCWPGTITFDVSAE